MADRLRLFGEIEAAEVALSELGEVVLEEWLRTEAVRPGWRMDAVVVMPNHLHGIVWIG